MSFKNIFSNMKHNYWDENLSNFDRKKNGKKGGIRRKRNRNNAYICMNL
jgi:hypothetical protein